MSEVRHDWVSDRWVIFAPSRSERPDEFESLAQENREKIGACRSHLGSNLDCPFCRGNESETPTSVLTLDERGVETDESQWKIRVVPNKFPAVIHVDDSGYPWEVDGLKTESEPPRSATTPTSSDRRAESLLFHRQPLFGAHEVIIESPNHVSSITELPLEYLESVLKAMQRRLAHWRRHPSLQYAVVFKNCGADAGASIIHSHSQLIATSFVPPEVARLCHRMEQFRQELGKCYGCTVVAEEAAKRERVIHATRRFVAYCPYASPLPYAMVASPIEHQSKFEDLSSEALSEFARLVYHLLQALELRLPNHAYNFVLHTSPFHDHWDHGFHWRFEVFPRLTKLAGFEWGSNCLINPVLPETAASELRASFKNVSHSHQPHPFHVKSAVQR